MSVDDAPAGEMSPDTARHLVEDLETLRALAIWGSRSNFFGVLLYSRHRRGC